MNLHKKKYNSKFILFTLFFLSIILLIWTSIFYNISKNTIESSFRSLAETTALTLSNIIEESSGDYKLLLETHDTDTDFYKEIYNVFHEITLNSDIKYTYTVQRKDETQIYYIIDSVPPDQEDSTPIGTEWDAGSVALQAFDTRSIVSSNFDYYSSWDADYLCAYSPIIDPNTQEILGLVGVDIDIQELRTKLNNLLYAALFTTFLILLFVYVLLSKFSDTLVRPYVMDTLTKSYNRKFFNTYFEQAFYYCKKKKVPLSVLILDIDHFKMINDTYGHPFGDVVLKKLCENIVKHIRKTDCFARYGGEEFVISLTNESEETAVQIADKLKTMIENLKITNKEQNKEVKFTISIGVASLDATSASTFDELLEKSDKALYYAKVERNSVKSYTNYLDSLNKKETT